MKLTYREWQSRNTQLFNSLDRQQQQLVRERGYCNVGWVKVKSSWELLQGFKDFNHKVASIFDLQLRRGNLPGAIGISQMEADNLRKIARTGIAELEKTYQKMADIADRVVDRYRLI